jgi:hypothetical protein
MALRGALECNGLLTTVICHSPASFLIIDRSDSFQMPRTLERENQMRVAVLMFTLSMTLQSCVQQQAPPATSADESIPIDPVSHNSPCAGQPRSLGELTAFFNGGRAPSAKELVGVWVEIGDFNHGMRPLSDEAPAHFRSLNCTGITRGKKFEFAMIGVSYAYVMELHAYGSSGAERQRMEPNRKGSVEFSIDLFCVMLAVLRQPMRAND